MSDPFKVTILEDGTLRVETGEFGGAQHMTAEKFMQFLAEEMGGNVQRVRRNKAHTHAHQRQEQKG